MMKVLDGGKVIKGLSNVHKGAFVFDDQKSLNSYLKRKEALEKTHKEVTELKDQIARLERIIQANG